MTNIQINETTLLKILMDRLKYWTTDEDVIGLYEDYFSLSIDCGCFENIELDINNIVDKLYCNTSIVDKTELERSNIDVNDSIKVLSKDETKDLYLISND